MPIEAFTSAIYYVTRFIRHRARLRPLQRGTEVVGDELCRPGMQGTATDPVIVHDVCVSYLTIVFVLLVYPICEMRLAGREDV